MRLIGPTNTVNMAITDGAAAWFDSGVQRLYLDSSSEFDDATSTRNKIDILGSVDTSGDLLYIYGHNIYGVWTL